MKIFIKLAILILLISVLTGCLPGDGRGSADSPVGFISGIWHGWVAPLSLVVSIFKGDIRVYEVYNTGWWYDLGFYMAIISGFGGISLSRKKMKKRKND